ncbi:MAG: amino acid adenylation domain-containing protein [Candidatus Aminicenantes bacterium]|nr:amino acid adenylation domain-containing protein [Candidatus Aminicenantes bacterium]NIM82877.1 amino acid adenylation domain-containing protein [Candidatus Aminicenantes bacterium]NIN22253.1 amino acid adenylation domain-containing protein [Candidatus Aminicenantes bacterium]NIN46021.1 amino acid adenylation domain-containing protein [Candidatus Aminicenantes bacterium]NIN88857.1 amino acid adenylation domain-containing protein [Candidatus Aminicenantes bacterium]
MIIERFEQQVKKYPDELAVKTEKGSVTYSELNMLSNRIANKINAISQSKSGRSNRNSKGNIGLLMDDALAMIASILGVLKAGHAYVPLVADFPGRRIGFIMDHAEIGILITDQTNKHRLPGAANKKDICFVMIEEITGGTPGDAGDTLVFSREVCSDGNAYLLYTSGSTGLPKAVRQTHRNILHFIDRFTENLDLTCQDKFTLFSSFSHDAAVMDIYTSLLNGAALFPLDLKKGGIFETLPQWLDEEEITVWHSVPTVYRYFVSSLAAAPDLSLLRYVVLGGEEVLRSDIEKFRSFFPGCRLYNLYGQTESTYNSGQFFEAGSSQAVGGGTVTLGDEVEGTEIVVVDEEGNEVEPLEVGEIILISEYVSPGYWQDEAGTRERFTRMPSGERVYFTGDLGRLLRDGKIEFLGRKDNQVKIRGYRVELGEIESAVMQYDMVTQAAAIAVKNPSGEQFIAVYFAARKNIDLNSLREFLEERLPDYMIPSYFRQLEKLPVTVSGKIDRKSLPAADLALRVEYAAPGNDIEKKLVEIWSELLQIGKDVIGINNSFFELGGHSLRAVMLTSKIHREFKVQLPLAEVFDRQTVKMLAEYIVRAKRKEYKRIAPVEQKEYYPASSVQERLYSIRQLDTEGTTYNIPLFFRLGKYADRERLENTFKRLVQRHEILRTTFEMVNREPVQRVHNPEAVDFTLDYYETSPEEAQEVFRRFIAPFDLLRAPLFRAALVKLQDDGDYFILFDFYHIIVDNASLNLLEADYLALYEDVNLPEVRLHYKDYSQWQNSEYQQDEVKQQGEYWLKLLEGELPVLDLPCDYPRPSLQSFAGRTVRLILTEEETMGLKKIAKELDATLYMLFLSAFNVLLFRLSSQEDIIVGTPMAARRHEDLQNIIGMFVNTLVMRNYPRGDKLFARFAAEVKQNTIAAYENQEYPFEDLVDTLAIPREAGRNPLFDAVFNLLEERAYQFEVSETTEAKALVYQTKSSKFDLTLTAIDREHQVVLRFEYSTQLFKAKTMERIIEYFKNILSEIQVNPAVRLAEIEIMTEVEKQRILDMSMETEARFDRDKTIHELFEERAARTPDGVSVVGSMQLAVGKKERSEEPVQLTYKELNEKSDQLAQLLRSKGIQPDSIVGIMVERSLEMIIGILGILKAGSAYLPIDPAYPQERIDYMLKDSDARVLLSELSKVSEVSKGTEVIDVNLTIAGNEDAEPTHLTHPTHLCYVIYTSGTTGRPKGTLTTHYNAIRVVKNSNYIDITSQDRVLQLSNYAFDGSVFDIYGALLNGAALVMIREEDVLSVDKLAKLIKKEAITLFFVTTALFNVLVDEKISGFDHVRKVLFGGERVSVEHCKKALGYLGRDKIIHVYGPTETTVYASYYPIDHIDENAVTIPIGQPISYTSIYILDKYLNPVPLMVTGEIYIGGDGVARGYLNQPQLTAEKFINILEQASLFPTPYSPTHLLTHSTIYRTGDLARWLADGNVEFLGRIDHQVKIRGFRVELGEIEIQLLNHDAVNEAVAVAGEDENKDKYLCAYIVSERELSDAELRNYLSKELPDYMIPSYFVFLEKIPLTTSGKIDRKRLPAPQLQEIEEYTAPRNPLEEILAKIWSEVLAVPLEKISIHANFFKLGGHSLKATRIAARLQQEGFVVPLSQILLSPTISKLAEQIKQSTKSNKEITRNNEPKVPQKETQA